MKLSVITVNLNNIIGLEKTRESLIAQTYKEYEWIVIDGGSTDGSRQFIELHSAELKYWVSEPDAGIYNAMNKGISAANGEYLLFLNSGDWLIDNMVFEKFFSSGAEEDIIFGYVARHINNVLTPLKGFLTKDDITISDLYYQTLPHQGTFFKRDLFNRFGLYDESLKIVADRKFFIKSIVYGNASVRFLPMIISYFEDGGVSSTSVDYQKEKRDILVSMIPPRVYNDMMAAVSKKEICKYHFFRMLYSMLYRCATSYNTMQKKKKLCRQK